MTYADWNPSVSLMDYLGDPSFLFMAAYERYEQGVATEQDIALLDEVFSLTAEEEDLLSDVS